MCGIHTVAMRGFSDDDSYDSKSLTKTAEGKKYIVSKDPNPNQDNPPSTTASESPTQSQISVSEAGRRGGNTVKKRYGTEFYQAIGRKGGLATRDKYEGTDFFENIGKQGGKKGAK